MADYRLGAEFPHEGFVQRAIEAHFCAPQHEAVVFGHVDWACIQVGSGKRWVVEAKGVTKDVGLDFRTGLGQLIQAMSDPMAFYGMAVPDTSKFLMQLRKVPDRVRAALGIHWLIIDASGGVVIIKPDESLDAIRK